jgi:hypothetical protein
MNKASTFLGGVALGAGLMYFLDNGRGSRRRALVRDKAVRGMHVSRDFLGKASRDLRFRARGLAAEARHRGHQEDVTDQVLVERVRSRMGHHVSHSHAIEVAADQGLVTLSGPILAEEAPGLLEAVHAVPGVRGVDDHLERHHFADHVPALQGGARPPGGPGGLRPTSWSPGLQLLAGLASGVALLYGTRLMRTHGANGHAAEDFDSADASAPVASEVGPS